MFAPPDWDVTIGEEIIDGTVVWERRPKEEAYDPITLSVPAGADGATAIHVTVLEITYDCFVIEIELNDGTVILDYLHYRMYPPETTFPGGGLGYFAQGDSPDKLIKSVTIRLVEDPAISASVWVKGKVYFSTRGGTPANGGFTDNH